MNTLKQFFVLACMVVALSLHAQEGNLYTNAASFSVDDKFVGTTWFHWYAVGGGQLSGPWRPLDGRENWTGLTPWWKTQIKQAMMANMDVLLVHLIPSAEERREPFFKALGELRAEGYDVPKVAPFLDPLITWFEQPKVNLATTAGKDEMVSHYIRWYNQYFNNNPDAFAQDYLAKIDNRAILSTWHLFINFDNPGSITQADITNRLKAAFPGRTLFNQPIYMITPAINNPTFNFTEERWPLFEINEYNRTEAYNGVRVAQLKAGYWDQNVRNPGSFLPRNGGTEFRTAWNQVNANVDRVYVESWNEYDEGTGIYAGDTGTPDRINGNTNNDVWSNTNDPYEYIRTNAAGAAAWNSRPELASLFLANDFPTSVTANTTETVSVTIRNNGDESWTNAAGFTLRQLAADAAQFGATGTIDDAANEIPIYGGIFRGRPITFPLTLNVPNVRGEVQTRWTMARNGVPFGEVLTITLNVLPPTGVFDFGPEIGLAIAPNPASDRVRVSWDAQEHKAKVTLHDFTGREVQTFTDVASGASLGLELPSGMYQMVFTVGGHAYTRRLVVR